MVKETTLKEKKSQSICDEAVGSSLIWFFSSTFSNTLKNVAENIIKYDLAEYVLTRVTLLITRKK